MNDLKLLTLEELAGALKSLPDWKLIGNEISLSLECADFAEAFALMCRIAILAEKLDHHPNWSNVFNQIEIRLSTHDAGGITDKDIRLAKLISAYAANIRT